MIILRGLPGSGKSTAARKLYEFAELAGLQCVVCSADDYWVGEDGVYAIDLTRLQEGHQWCQSKAEEALSKGVDVVVIDNVNYQQWHFAAYLALAEKYAVKCGVLSIGNREDVEVYQERNTHGVPLHTIRRMAEQWED